MHSRVVPIWKKRSLGRRDRRNGSTPGSTRRRDLGGRFRRGRRLDSRFQTAADIRIRSSGREGRNILSFERACNSTIWNHIRAQSSPPPVFAGCHSGYTESMWTDLPGIKTTPRVAAADGRLVDAFGRVHNNLRISVTDRCNIRCVYCMPETVEFLARESLLSFEEIERFVRIAAALGIDKVRLTGGEPLVRRELPALVAKLAAMPGIVDIGLTTNGILLAPLAEALWSAGLRRINVSLDTMDPARFQELSRRPGLEQVIEGILAAKAAGFDPVKLNAIAIKGMTEGGRPPPGPVRENARPGAAIHRVHAARRRRSLGARGRSSTRRRSSRPSRARSARWRPRPTRTRERRPSITTMRTAAAASGSSLRSAAPSARAATASA